MTQSSWNSNEVDEIDFAAGYGTAVAMTRKHLPIICGRQAKVLGGSLPGKEASMTQDTSNTSEMDEIEFAISYGTAVAMTRSPRSILRGDRAEVLAGAGGDMTRGPEAAAASGEDSRAGDSKQADDAALTSVPPPARRSIRLAAAGGAGKGRGRKPQASGDTNRRRKAA